MDEMQVVYLLTVLVGFGFVAGGVVASDAVDTGGYYLVITDEGASVDEVSNDSSVVAYENLSPELQHAFLEALEDEDRRYEFDGTGPDSFEAGMTVQYQGRYYTLGRLIGTNTGGLASLLSIWGPPAGIVLAAIGVTKYRSREAAQNG